MPKLPAGATGVAVRIAPICLIVCCVALLIGLPFSTRAQSGLSVLSVTMKPTTVVSGASSTGTVTLSNPAPSGGVVVKLISGDSSVGVPGAIQVASGQTQATFTATTRTPIVTTITAKYSTSSAIGNLTVIAPGTNPKVPIGGSASFRPSGQQSGGSTKWDISLNNKTLATDTSPVGWAVTCDGNSDPIFTVAAPLTAVPATGYKVTCVLSGQRKIASFDAVPRPGGPIGLPVPAWAEDVVPTDGVPGGGAGPSSATSVELSTGILPTTQERTWSCGIRSGRARSTSAVTVATWLPAATAHPASRPAGRITTTW